MKDMTPKERSELIALRMAEEEGADEVCLWMSFCDQERPKGDQFLGVVIMRAPGIAHAIARAWSLGINPGGEVMSYVTDDSGIQPEHFDRLLSKADLVAAGYVETTA